MTGILRPLPNLLPHREGKAGFSFRFIPAMPGKGYFSKEVLTKTKPVLLAQEEEKAPGLTYPANGFLTVCQSSIS